MSGMTRPLRVAFGIGATCGDCVWLGTRSGLCGDRQDPKAPACPMYKRVLRRAGVVAADGYLASEHSLWGRTCDTCGKLRDRVAPHAADGRVGWCQDTGLACLSGEYCSGWRRRWGEGR